MPLSERSRVLRWWQVSSLLSWHPAPGVDPPPLLLPTRNVAAAAARHVGLCSSSLGPADAAQKKSSP